MVATLFRSCSEKGKDKDYRAKKRSLQGSTDKPAEEVWWVPNEVNGHPKGCIAKEFLFKVIQVRWQWY